MANQLRRLVPSTAQRAIVRQTREEPRAIVAGPINILRIRPHLPQGNRQSTTVADDNLTHESRSILPTYYKCRNGPLPTEYNHCRILPWVTNSGAIKVTFTGEINTFMGPLLLTL